MTNKEAKAETIVVRAAGFLFDMDGVLVSSLGSVMRSWRKWAAHYGVHGAETLEIPHGMRAVELVKRLAPHADVDEAMRLIEEMEVADVDDIEVLPGARALLESLPGERWAIVTSATRKLVVVRLKAAGLLVPELLVCADDVTKGKPDPEPYVMGAARVGVAAAECVVVEDAPNGVEAGKAAGARVLGVLGTHTAEELRKAGADWVVGSLVDVKAMMMEGGLELRLVEV